MKFPNDIIHSFPTREDFIAKHLREDKSLSHLPSIPEFFKGKEIFITGGTGFIGKVLIEKLLRSCPDIKVIYLLMREKKGQSLNERLENMAKLNLFDLLRIKNPKFALKLVPVGGDVSQIDLGLSEESKKLMKNISIIFHSAASVRFDDSLKYAVIMNTRGTRELMKFAESLPKIKVVMHVSTTYSNVYLQTVEEKIYPPLADWKKTIEICEKSKEDQTDWLTQHFINFMPNTYVFSKNLAEHVTLEFQGKLPLILFRPSVVLSACDEPFAGYVRFFLKNLNYI
jgi:fatty acyl-CoA reductase